jgi:N utilization substance protein B
VALTQQKFREMVLQILFSLQFTPFSEEIVYLMKEQLVVSKSLAKAAADRALAIRDLESKIDPLIQEASPSYELSRIGAVEVTVIRLAIYEILFDTEIPEKVAISEAVRLARKFSTKEAGVFVNAVLDAVWKKQMKPFQEG